MKNQRNIIVTQTENTLSVSSPYLLEWVEKARLLSGKWEPNTKTWQFNTAIKPAVLSALMEIFGEDGVTPIDFADIELTYNNFAYADRSPYCFAGREIAKAYGRDSGAKPGLHKVFFTQGKPTSAGSIKNWDTRIPTGTVIVLTDVPIPMVNRIRNSENPVVAIINKGDN